MVLICIRLLWISFEWFESDFEWLESFLERFEFGIEWLESISNHLNLHSIASNLVQKVQICIRMIRIPFAWFKGESGLYIGHMKTAYLVVHWEHGKLGTAWLYIESMGLHTWLYIESMGGCLNVHWEHMRSGTAWLYNWRTWEVGNCPNLIWM